MNPSEPGPLPPILLATTNPGKLREFRQLLQPAIPAERIRCLSDFPPLEPPEETGATFLANARIKALYYSNHFPHLVVVAEDSGLEVPALDGEPGTHSARYAGPEASDRDNIRLLLQRLDGVTDRRARFVTRAAIAWRGKVRFHCRGRVDGRILNAPRGANGFGYDPVFLYPGSGMTFAEMENRQKNHISHRGQAMQKVKDFLTRSMPREIGQ